jgi:hypothetical protein
MGLPVGVRVTVGCPVRGRDRCLCCSRLRFAVPASGCHSSCHCGHRQALSGSQAAQAPGALRVRRLSGGRRRAPARGPATQTRGRRPAGGAERRQPAGAPGALPQAPSRVGRRLCPGSKFRLRLRRRATGTGRGYKTGVHVLRRGRGSSAGLPLQRRHVPHNRGPLSHTGKQYGVQKNGRIGCDTDTDLHVYHWHGIESTSRH